MKRKSERRKDGCTVFNEGLTDAFKNKGDNRGKYRNPYLRTCYRNGYSEGVLSRAALKNYEN